MKNKKHTNMNFALAAYSGHIKYIDFLYEIFYI